MIKPLVEALDALQNAQNRCLVSAVGKNSIELIQAEFAGNLFADETGRQFVLAFKDVPRIGWSENPFFQLPFKFHSSAFTMIWPSVGGTR